MASRWTDNWVRSLEHPDSGKPERVFHDPTLSGHRLAVKRTRKVFEVQADQPRRFWVNGKRKTFVVQTGDALETTIDQSRERAIVVLGRIRKGEDPRDRSPERETTLGGAWEEFKKRSDLGSRTLAMYEGAWNRCLAMWKDQTLRGLVENPRMARDEHANITKNKGPSEAEHAMRLLRSIYRHSARLETSLPGDRHPCSAVEWHGDRTRKDAAIPATQMPTWKKEVEGMRNESPLRAAFQILLLRLGCRPGELAGARWDQIDFERKLFWIPVSKTEEYEVPLSPQAVAEFKALLDARMLNRPGDDFIFPARGKDRHLKRLKEDRLSYSSNSMRHSHKTIGTILGIDELVLDVCEGHVADRQAGNAQHGRLCLSRLAPEWQGEYERRQKRDLSARRYVYVWADGVFLQARMEDHGECMLVLIGATPDELLVEAKSRGLKIAPEIAVGDGALGFWKALDEVFPRHATSAVLGAQNREYLEQRPVSRSRSSEHHADRD
jgi:integrase